MLSKVVAVDLLDLEKKFAKEDDDLLVLEVGCEVFFTEDDKALASIFCLETTNLESIWFDETVGEDS
jgi:hypothetical protein